MSDGPSYTRMAFHNALNYAFLGATAVFTAWQWPQLAWMPLAVGAAVEAAWLLVGARTGSARRYFNFVHQEKHKQIEAGERQAILRGVGEHDRERYGDLERLKNAIHEQVRSNPSLTMELVGGELKKIDELLETFLGLAATAARYEHYVETSDLNQIEEEVRRQEAVLEKIGRGEGRELALRNLEVLKKRLDKAVEIRKQVRNARGQLNLIDNTFRLLRDQILTMQSPAELSGQIDDLTRAIDSIEATGKETDALAKQLDNEIAALRN